MDFCAALMQPSNDTRLGCHLKLGPFSSHLIPVDINDFRHVEPLQSTPGDIPVSSRLKNRVASMFSIRIRKLSFKK